MWVEFARGMAPLMAMPAELVAKLLKADEGAKWKALSLAAGHGLYEVTLARHNRNAEVWAVDWANVLEVAKENAAAAGVAGRYHTIPGSAFDVEYGDGYDIAGGNTGGRRIHIQGTPAYAEQLRISQQRIPPASTNVLQCGDRDEVA